MMGIMVVDGGKGVCNDLDLTDLYVVRNLFLTGVLAIVLLPLLQYSSGIERCKLGKAELPLSCLWEPSFSFICI